MGITAVMTVHNINKIRYPWRYSIRSVWATVDEIIILDAGPHEDDTSASVEEFVNSASHEGYKIRTVKADWPISHEGLSALTNIGIDRAKTDWVFQLQADEIMAEWSLEALNALSSFPLHIKAAKFNFVHYCGDPWHIFPFMYERVIRACRKQSNYRAVGDAAEFVGYGPVAGTSIEVHHVGKIHLGREEAGAFKEYDFQSTLYKNLFPVDPKIVAAKGEGKINYFRVFSEALDRGEVKDYSGPWPNQMKAWMSELGFPDLETIHAP